MFEQFLVVLQAIGAVLLVCGVAYLFIRYGLRPVYRPGGSGSLKVVDRVPLDTRGSSALLLVKMGDKIMLLGVTQGSISLIKEVPAYELGVEKEEELPEKPWENLNFSKMLKRFTGKNHPP